MKTKNLTLTEALATGLPFRIMDSSVAKSGLWQDIHEAVVRTQDVIKPIWEVKQEPREWTLYYATMFGEWRVKIASLTLNDDVERIKVREVIE